MQSVVIDGEYEIYLNKVIGKGEYGKVVECIKTTGSQKQLCAKIIQVADEVSARREAEILTDFLKTNQFNPNIVQVNKVKYDEDKQVLLVIMEKCSTNLQKEITKKFTDQEIWDFLKQMMTGYKFLYEKNILHRDIKPENILIEYLNDKPIYKLADFGVGKIYKHNDYKFTKRGTPVYSAPEGNILVVNDQELMLDQKQHKSQNEKAFSKIDIYSIGIILLQMLLGGLPFQGNVQGIMDFFKILKLQDLNPKQFQNRDQNLVNLIMGMVKYYPSKRSSFAQIQECLQRQQFNRFNAIDPIKINHYNSFQNPMTNVQNMQSGHNQQKYATGPSEAQLQQSNWKVFIPQPQPVQQVQQNLQIQKQMNQTGIQQFQPNQQNFSFLPNQNFQPNQQIGQPEQRTQPKPPLQSVQQIQTYQQNQQEDNFLKEFINILQLILDTYRSNNQNQEVVSILSQFPLNQIPSRDNDSFKSYLGLIKQYFKYDSFQSYGEQYIKLIFGLRYYTQEIDQNIDPSTLDLFKMRQNLNK